MSVVLGFDYGTTKIGVAVGQTITRQARPLEIIAATSDIHVHNRIDALVQKFKPVALVLGRPLDLDEKPYALTEQVEAFGAALVTRYQLPVHYIHEALTSKAAREYVPDKTKHVDAVAAAIILEEWLTGM